MLSQGTKYILIATVFFAAMNVCVKALPRIPTHEIVFFRAWVALTVCIIMLRAKGISPWGTHKKLLIGRGIAGTIALTLFFYTVSQMPLASAMTIQYLAPIMTIIIATFMVKEKASPLQYLYFLLAFAGIFLINGFDVRVSGTELAIGIGADFFSGLAYNFIRKLKGQ